jgi:hypothetical protein
MVRTLCYKVIDLNAHDDAVARRHPCVARHVLASDQDTAQPCDMPVAP